MSIEKCGYVDVPCGSSVISSGATWPKRSLVAWTEELKPLANLFADWPRLRPEMLDWSLFQPSIVCRTNRLGRRQVR